EEFRDSHVGQLIVTSDEYERARRCADSVHSRPYAMELLEGEREQQIEWEWLGRKCSSRLDCLGEHFVTDLKTSNTVQPDRFRAACTGRFSYHAQLAFYYMAAQYIGSPVRLTHIIGVETQPPYDVTVLRMTPRALEAGFRLCRIWME